MTRRPIASDFAPWRDYTQKVKGLISELRSSAPGATVFSYETPNVVFLLAAQPRHATYFRQRLQAIQQSFWSEVGKLASSKTTGNRQILAREE